MVEACPVCGGPITDCICTIDIRANRPKDVGGAQQALPRLLWPVPKDTRVTQVFGVNPGWYPTSQGHNGVDFGTVVDTPCKAMKKGDVIVARNDLKVGYGRHVRIQHDDGISIYGHLHVLMCNVGDHVEAGQVIGLTGGATSDPGSGFSTGPHLHAEYRLTNVPNPVPGGYVYNAIDILPLLVSTLVRIVDVSGWDDPIDYGEYDGVIPRCWNGSVKDSMFEIHKAGAKAAGVPWWAYAFYNFKKPAMPQAQAVASILAVDKGNIPPYWDVEEWRYWDEATQTWVYVKYPARDILLGGMFTLYDTYKTMTGLTSGFYLNPATIHYLKPIPSWLLLCPEWIAHWGVSNPDYEPWLTFTFHQYEGEPDHSKFYDTDEKYWAYVKGTPLPPPTLPDYFTAINDVRIRGTPVELADLSNHTGWLRAGKKFHPDAVVKDALGREWWMANKYGFVAKWLTRW